MADVVVVCHTPGCGNEGHEITLTTVKGTSVMCGPCGRDCEVISENDVIQERN
jgi:hypothetical protein